MAGEDPSTSGGSKGTTPSTVAAGAASTSDSSKLVAHSDPQQAMSTAQAQPGPVGELVPEGLIWDMQEAGDMGDIDLWALSPDGENLVVNERWLQHLRARCVSSLLSHVQQHATACLPHTLCCVCVPQAMTPMPSIH